VAPLGKCFRAWMGTHPDSSPPRRWKGPRPGRSNRSSSEPKEARTGQEKEARPGERSRNASPPPRLAVDRGEKGSIRHFWHHRRDSRARAAAPVSHRTTIHVANGRPASTRYPRERATAVRNARKLPSERLIPSCSGPAVCVRFGSHRAPCTGGGLPPRSSPGSLRLPTGTPLQISNESSRSRAAGVMATSDR